MSDRVPNWPSLRRRLHRSGGDLILAQDGSLYESARQVFNAGVQRRPSAIAYCRTTKHVVTCVEFCVHHGITISCRGGGHGALGFAVQDGALLLDLTGLQAIEVDLRNRTVSVGGGARWGQVDLATYPSGYVSPGGGCPTVGVGGLAQGGGLGPLARSVGLTVHFSI